MCWFYYVPKIIIIKANNKETKFLYIYRLRPNCVSKISNFFIPSLRRTASIYVHLYRW